MVEKASGLPSDMIVLDLEDSVPQGEKLAARTIAAGAVTNQKWHAREVGIRINSLDTDLWRQDLEAVVAAGAGFVVVPKVEGPRDIEKIEAALQGISGKPGPEVAVTIESPRGLISMEKILSAAHSVTAAIFGAEDYTLSLGLHTLDRPPASASFARSYVAIVARAFGIDPIAEAFVNVSNLEGLKTAAIEAKYLGYAGKAVIHPSQIPVVNDAFSPSADEVEWAKEVLNAWNEAKSQGKAAFRVRDRMVDSVHIKMAEEISKIVEQSKAVPSVPA